MITGHEAERGRFIAWTLEHEFARIEDLLGTEFDRDAPTADVSVARYNIRLRFEVEIADGVFEQGDDGFPRFLGHDMWWWTGLAKNGLSFLIMPLDDCERLPCILDHLGIKDAVLRWIADANAWHEWKATARRRAAKSGRNLIAEEAPDLWARVQAGTLPLPGAKELLKLRKDEARRTVMTKGG